MPKGTKVILQRDTLPVRTIKALLSSSWAPKVQYEMSITSVQMGDILLGIKFFQHLSSVGMRPHAFVYEHGNGRECPLYG